MGSTLLDAGFLYCILSASSLDPNSSGLQAPSVGWGLPYHISSLTLWGPLATASGVFRVPPRSGVAFPTTSGLYCLEFDWQLHRGFPRSPSVGCGLPYHISSLTLWESAGNCIGGFREPPRSGVAFPTTSGLYCLEFDWQLHRGFPRSPSVGCGLPYHISSLTLWESAGNCIGGFREPPRSGVAFLTTSGLYCLEFY